MPEYPYYGQNYSVANSARVNHRLYSSYLVRDSYVIYGKSYGLTVTLPTTAVVPDVTLTDDAFAILMSPARSILSE